MTASHLPTLPDEPRYLRIMSRTGWILLLAWTGGLVLWAIFQPDPYAQGWRLVVEMMFFGRLVNIADGIANGFSHGYLLYQSMFQDIILLLILFPWMVASYLGARKWRLVDTTLERIRITAERNKRVVEPFGAIGLWGFVFFPFWSTGVLVGGMVGYLLGMRVPIIFASVVSGHIISVVILIWFFDAVRDVAQEFNEGIVRYIPWIVIAVVLLLGVIASRTVRTEEAPADGAGRDVER